MEAAVAVSRLTKLQGLARGFAERARLRREHKAVLEAKGVALDEADDDRALRKAMLILDGKVMSDGVIRYPKGTVVRLIRDRTKYAEMLERQHRKQAKRDAAIAHAKGAAKQAVAQMLRADEADTAGGKARRDGDPPWSTKEWLEGLHLSDVIAECLLEAVHSLAPGRAELEKLFISKLGQSASRGERVDVVRGLLLGTPLVERIVERVCEGAERIDAELTARRAAGPVLKGAHSKFFDSDGRTEGAAGGDGGIELVFGGLCVYRGSNSGPPHIPQPLPPPLPSLLLRCRDRSLVPQTRLLWRAVLAGGRRRPDLDAARHHPRALRQPRLHAALRRLQLRYRDDFDHRVYAGAALP
jgi:hypothetical protein